MAFQDIIADLGILSILMPFLLVFAIVYGLLSKTKSLSDRSDINAIAAMVIAFISATNEPFSLFIVALIPWFVILIVIFFVGMLFFSLFGVQDFSKVVRRSWFLYPMIILALIIIFVVFGQIFPAAPIDPLTDAGEVNKTLISGPEKLTILFQNPTVLGFIVLMILMAVAIGTIAYPDKGK